MGSAEMVVGQGRGLWTDGVVLHLAGDREWVPSKKFAGLESFTPDEFELQALAGSVIPMLYAAPIP